MGANAPSTCRYMNTHWAKIFMIVRKKMTNLELWRKGDDQGQTYEGGVVALLHTSAAAHLWANSIRFCLFLIGKFYSLAMLGLLIPILLLNLVVQSIFVLAWKSKQQRAKKNWRQKWWNQKLCRYKGICCRYVPTTYAGFIQANTTSFNRIWLVNLRSRLERQAPTVSSFVT